MAVEKKQIRVKIVIFHSDISLPEVTWMGMFWDIAVRHCTNNGWCRTFRALSKLNRPLNDFSANINHPYYLGRSY